MSALNHVATRQLETRLMIPDQRLRVSSGQNKRSTRQCSGASGLGLPAPVRILGSISVVMDLQDDTATTHCWWPSGTNRKELWVLNHVHCCVRAVMSAAARLVSHFLPCHYRCLILRAMDLVAISIYPINDTVLFTLPCQSMNDCCILFRGSSPRPPTE